MRAIVTGAAGFIASHLVDRLIEQGWEVLAIDDLSGGTTDEHVNRGARFIQARVQDCNFTNFPDAIFHLAGKVGPVGVTRHAGEIALDTIQSADVVGRWATDWGCPLIDISTSEVYGDASKANSEYDPTVFQHSPSARKEYAVGKLAAETMLRNRKYLDVKVVRFFNVTGPRQSPVGGFVIPRFVLQALRGEPLTVYAPGTQVRSFSHVDDIIDGLMLIYEKGVSGEVYNLGNPYNACTMTELAEEVLDYIPGRYDIVDPITLHGASFREAPDKTPDASKVMALGWAPVLGRCEIIEDVFDYWCEREVAAQ
jgi:UDP-glucose 4-epimerase